MSTHENQARDFLRHLSTAQSEAARKEQFVTYLNQVFGADEENRKIIQEFNRGAEKQLRIPRPERAGGAAGRADTQYRDIIIEFERDIKAPAKLSHAEDQLRDYFAANYNAGRRDEFRLIATDGVRWRVYGVAASSYVGAGSLTSEMVKFGEPEVFVLASETAAGFFAFIDRHLFRTQQQQPTLDNILYDFGDSSALYASTFEALKSAYQDAATRPELKVAYREWRKFMSLAYGSFDDSPDVFVVHTYLSIFSKLMAYELLSAGQNPDLGGPLMRQVLTGHAFDNLQVENFVENDFYQWIAADDQAFAAVLPALRRLAAQLADYDYRRTEADILKGIYQSLVSKATKQALGEYYTPDWLCQQVVDSLHLAPEARVLDPACGSGSFLLAAVRALVAADPARSVEDLCQQVAGIDIHPLSVQIAKTTLLLALGQERVSQARRKVRLRVYLANTLDTPAGGRVGLFEDEMSVYINGRRLGLPALLLDHPALFDVGIRISEKLAVQTKGLADAPADTLARAIKNEHNASAPTGLYNAFHFVYRALKKAKETRHDSIWQFLLRNTYQPFFLKQQFDVVVGNPPWFTYNAVENADYQKKLLRLAVAYHLKPTRKALMPQLEIAAIFMAHAASYLLRAGGRLAFVLPRSFLSADQHAATRLGTAQGFRLTGVWDLKAVQPLFPVPACVLFAEASPVPYPIPAEGLPGRHYTGRPRRHNATWPEAEPRLTVQKVTWHVAQNKSSSALTTNEVSDVPTTGGTFYKEMFKNGAVAYPRNFFFIKPEGTIPLDWVDRSISVRSDEANDKDAKEPWKSVKLKGRINTNFLFRTALAKNLVPFGLLNPALIVLPVVVQPNPASQAENPPLVPVIYTPDELRELGQLDTAHWFEQVEKSWDKHRTEKNGKITATKYLNWQNKLTDQQVQAPYVVIYSASGKDANAYALRRKELDLPFFADNKSYVFYTSNEEEAHYLSAFLNSNQANEDMKPFQSTGLFGARDVHRKILDVPLPRFSAANAQHQVLAALGREAAAAVAAYVAESGVARTDYAVGKVRRHLRQVVLVELLPQIDAALANLLPGASAVVE
ncbi:N-6 DNA methylase [Hymenobacter siberiensis]|uniref:N-6 DNA methylase n=1 Tax=Hymenobacter siberiensis TaxID=2848396 RepID=UPI001C1DDDEE|nr:N-6 DNA methylase [Hymenobacter siberiensis]